MFSLAVQTFGEDYNNTSVPDRLAVELRYIQRRSLLFDLRVVITAILITISKGNVKGKE